ncbi:TonB-dependent receptor plug domain-containing protein [Psychromarinibacter sp. C21-152]|uniref:TonB-dependent receptor plug domain-containing protein n=1 Tax=Psychromarinibacter sediminicola TaxID=3033385 RepID=A0AAE3NT95_9RHOB|nr:TonB-dependent receptor plug domain-containing protein [Psychromarinibacter sediminicola]MDF0601999.1 TonB-dependent receptor plug domain-containing protein [Psychromarinibacter sediminicola]
MRNPVLSLTLTATLAGAALIGSEAQGRDFTHCKRSLQLDGASPVSVVTSEQIAAAPALDRLPGLNVPGLATTTQDGSGQINLRGLGQNNTLVLLNGRRVGTGYSFENAPIPQSAIERIEVLSDGAAAIYGSDAVAGVVNIITTGSYERTGLATENGGFLVNPATGFDVSLNGFGIGAEYSLCFGQDRVLPYKLTFGLLTYELDGTDTIRNETYLEGLGATGIGGIPGFYINSPTDLVLGEIDVERSGIEFDIRLDAPLTFGVYGGGGLGSFGTTAPRPTIGVTGFVGGVRFGILDQNETTNYFADTPAFGVNSDWQTRYDTDFDGTFGGIYGGFEHRRAFEGVNDSITTFSLSGIAGLDYYCFNVREQILATGLGGALNYANTEDHEFDDTQFRLGLRTGLDWQYRNLNIGAGLSVDWGKYPRIDRFLPDSDAVGALDPVYSLDGGLSYELSLKATYRF